MVIKEKSPSPRKTVSVLIMLTVFLFVIGMGNSHPAYAQDLVSETPTREIKPAETTVPTTDVDGQIVGGALADPGEYPWQIELNNYHSASRAGGYSLCGGSLINAQWVLTAAHCVTESNDSVSLASYFDIWAGEYDRTGVNGYTYRSVIQVIRYPSYNSNTLDSDIALLQLSSNLPLGEGANSPYTRIASIPPVEVDTMGNLVGFNAWATGWGNTISYGTPGGYPNQLREVQLPIYDNSCNDGYHWSGIITNNMICAGSDAGGHDICDGDSGGPLIVWNANTRQWNLAGVASFVHGACAEPNGWPGVFTRVSQFEGWLDLYMPSTTLTVNVIGTGSGSVTSNPAGINCGADCSEVYGYNDVVTLTATTSPGSMFDGWSGACVGTGSCIVSMTDAKSVTASFTFKKFNDPGQWTSSFDLSHGWTVADYVRTVGDVNNDGRDDLIGFGQDGVYVALSNGTGFDSVSKWTSSFDLSHGWTVANFVRTVGDVNNDGQDDLIGFGQDGVYVALSNGTSFDAISKWSSSFDLSHGWTVASFVRTVGDVNNDGRDDLIGFGSDGVYVALSNGTSFDAISKWSSSFDLSHGWTVASFVRTVGDVNNDGRDDLIGFGLDGVYVALSNGTSFDAVSKWSSSFDLSHGWTVSGFVRTVGDVNNDGRDDLLGFGADGVYVALSNGTSFDSVSRWTNDFDLSHGWTVSQFVRTVGDVNNDGKSDLVGFGLDGVYVGTAK